MASADSASSQLQPFLPGMGNSSAIGRAVRAKKQPHQMTPDEFAAAPNAVFHTSFVNPEDTLRTDNRREDWKAGLGSSPHVHVGTEQAAIENADRMEQNDVPQMAKDDGADGYGRLHTYWYHPKPGDSMEVHNDSEVYTRPEYGDMHPDDLYEKFHDYDPERAYNSGDFDPKYEYSHDVHPFSAVLYKNTGEDRGSLAISVGDTSRLKTHGDYVREAISQGKGDEVHPKTMAMFKAGHLDNGAILPPGFVRKVSSNNGVQVWNPRGSGEAGNPRPIEFDDNAGMSEEATRKWHQDYDVPDAPKTRYSDFGPNLEAIQKMARKKR